MVYMATTIQVEKETLELLKGFKEQTDANTYDEAIKMVLKSKKSMYGALGKKKSMKEILRGLRDEGDRI